MDGVPVLRQYQPLTELLQARAPGVAGLFAEPWLDAKPETPISRVSWYAAANQNPVAIRELPLQQRLTAEQMLQDRFAALVPLFSDPATAPLVRAALCVSDISDVLWTGEAPVLVNWGVVPALVGTDPDSLARHFDLVFGDLLPRNLNPWRSGDPAASGVRADAGAARPGAPPPVPPSVAPPPGPPPPPLPPRSAGGGGWWLPASALGAIMAAIAIVLLLSVVAGTAGYYYGWRSLVGRMQAAAPVRDPQFDDDLLRIKREVNEGLRRRVARLELTMRGNQCVLPEGPLPALPDDPQRPGGQQQTGPQGPGQTPGQAPGQTPGQTPGQQASPVLPPPPEQQPVPPQPPAPNGNPAAQPANLADLLDASVVLVIVPITRPNGETGTISGTGFAIAPDRVVTNFHVVEEARPGNLQVISRKLNHLVAAEVVAHTPGHDFGQPDFAVLKLQENVNLTPLALSTSVDRLLPVVAVGFPGFVTQVGDDWQRMRRGDPASIPAPHFTSGEVSAIQSFRGQQVLIHTASINRGNSGGPLADRCGRVVGVNTFMRTDAEAAYTVDYALLSATLLDFLKQNGAEVRQANDVCQPLAAGGVPPATPGPTPPGPRPGVAAPAPAAPGGAVPPSPGATPSPAPPNAAPAPNPAPNPAPTPAPAPAPAPAAPPVPAPPAAPR